MEIQTPRRLLFNARSEGISQATFWKDAYLTGRAIGPGDAILTGDANELMAPIHDCMTVFVEPREYEEYLTPADRPPRHLLRILPSEKMRSRLVGNTPMTNQQVGLFDSQ